MNKTNNTTFTNKIREHSGTMGRNPSKFQNDIKMTPGAKNVQNFATQTAPTRVFNVNPLQNGTSHTFFFIK